jgi:hypothetical protein
LFLQYTDGMRCGQVTLWIAMSLDQHARTEKGTFRKERSDSLVKHLREEYSEFKGINGNTKLGTLEKQLGVDSLNKVREALRGR